MWELMMVRPEPGGFVVLVDGQESQHPRAWQASQQPGHRHMVWVRFLSSCHGLCSLLGTAGSRQAYRKKPPSIVRVHFPPWHRLPGPSL